MSIFNYMMAVGIRCADNTLICLYYVSVYSCRSVSGSKLSMLALVHLASLFDVCLMVAFGILIYLRKQSLDQRPKACMSHFGQPAAAAVEAAPMRRE